MNDRIRDILNDGLLEESGENVEDELEDYLDDYPEGNPDDQMYSDPDNEIGTAADKNQAQWDLITEWVMEYQAPGTGSTEKTMLRSNILLKLIELLIPGYFDGKGTMRREKHNLTAEEQVSALTTRILEKDLLMKYDSEKSPFRNFIKFHFGKAQLEDYDKFHRISFRKDIKSEDAEEPESPEDKRKKTERKRIYVSSLNSPLNTAEETEVTLQDVQADTRAGVEDEVVGREMLNSGTLSLITLMVGFLGGKSQKEAEQRRYNRLFFTDDMVQLLRYQILDAIKSRKRDVLQTLSFPFIDFFMKDDFSSRQNQTLERVHEGKMKRYCDIIEGDKNCEIEQPLRNRIYTTYLFRKEGKKVGDPAIANHRKKYTKLKEECRVEL